MNICFFISYIYSEKILINFSKYNIINQSKSVSEFKKKIATNNDRRIYINIINEAGLCIVCRKDNVVILS